MIFLQKLYGEVVIYRDILEAKPHFEDGGFVYVTDPVKQKRKRKQSICEKFCKESFEDYF